jgi:hypothetical protein
MTDLRRAAEMALTALDALYVNDYSGYEISKHERHVVDEAIQALRQALAQPEKPSTGNVLMDAYNDTIAKKKPPVKTYAGGKPNYCTPDVDGVNISQEHVDETAKGEHEPVAWIRKNGFRFDTNLEPQDGSEIPLYTAPPKKEWVGLTDEEKEQATGWSVEHIEAKLKEKNGG